MTTSATPRGATQSGSAEGSGTSLVMSRTHNRRAAKGSRGPEAAR